jgi:hypothetical protein
MKVEEHTALIHELRSNLTDEGKVSEILTKLSQDYGQVTAVSAEHEKKSTELTAANEKLRSYNMELFLQVGKPATPQPQPQPETKPTFESLFDEKGNLK